MTDPHAAPAVPTLVPIADLSVEIGAPIVVGETTAGLRRIIPILGGTATGKIEGRIQPGGADFQILKRDNVTELEARYVIETKSGLVYVVNNGVRSGPKHVMDALARGEQPKTGTQEPGRHTVEPAGALSNLTAMVSENHDYRGEW